MCVFGQCSKMLLCPGGTVELLFKSGMWEYFLLRDVTTQRGDVGLRRAALTAELLLVLQPR